MQKILVCGEILLDVFAESITQSGKMAMQAQVGGSCANVAIGAARLGSQSYFLSALPDNPLGTQLYNYLQQQHVQVDYVVRKPQSLPLAFVSLDRVGHPDYTFYADNTCEQNLLMEDLPDNHSQFQLVHVASYPLTKQPTSDTLYQFISRLKNRCLISYDPNVRLTLEPNIAIWKQQIDKFTVIADVIKVSSEDLQCIYATRDYESIVVGWLNAGAKLVVVTDGAEGSTAYHQAGKYHQACYAVEVIDTVGAGDSFQCALLYSLSQYECGTAADIEKLLPEQIRQLLQFAAASAAITCSRQGPDLPNFQEVSNFIGS